VKAEVDACEADDDPSERWLAAKSKDRWDAGSNSLADKCAAFAPCR
jgi:hypothetical protein